jgi:hypothetical protein
MTKSLLISIAAALPLLAQVPPAGNAFQQEGWLRFPDPNRTTSVRNAIDGQSGPVLGRPLSASEVRHTEQILSDGSRTSNSETEHFYRDSMGRMRTETSTGAVLYDPVAGFIYDLNSDRKTYTKIPIGPDSVVTIAAAAHHWSSSSQSGNGKKKAATGPVTDDLQPQFLNGVYAKGARVTTTIPAGTIGNDHDLKVVNERWYSDDLKLLLKSSNSDPRFGTTTYELTDISQAAPDPTLFQIPADYTQGGDR